MTPEPWCVLGRIKMFQTHAKATKKMKTLLDIKILSKIHPKGGFFDLEDLQHDSMTSRFLKQPWPTKIIWCWNFKTCFPSAIADCSWQQGWPISTLNQNSSPWPQRLNGWGILERLRGTARPCEGCWLVRVEDASLKGGGELVEVWWEVWWEIWWGGSLGEGMFFLFFLGVVGDGLLLFF